MFSGSRNCLSTLLEGGDGLPWPPGLRTRPIPWLDVVRRELPLCLFVCTPCRVEKCASIIARIRRSRWHQMSDVDGWHNATSTHVRASGLVGRRINSQPAGEIPRVQSM
eukprot:357422-Chlamydomonas_euryale.AAC.3